MTSALRLCPKCGGKIPADAPGGGCPGCLLHAGLARFTEELVGARDASTITATEAVDGGSAERVEANVAAAVRQNKKAARDVETLGELGDYELLEVVGRGGQGWYFGPGKRVSIAQCHSR